MDSIIYWQLWFIVVARYLAKPPVYQSLEDFIRFNNACISFRNRLPVPRSRIKKWLTSLLLQEMDRHIAAIEGLVKNNAEILLVEDDRK